MMWLTLHVCRQSGHQVSNSCSNMVQKCQGWVEEQVDVYTYV